MVLSRRSDAQPSRLRTLASAPAQRFGARMASALFAVLALAVPLSLLTLLIAGQWPPLLAADQRVQLAVHRVAVSSDPLVTVAHFFTWLGDAEVRLTLVAVVAAVLIRRRAVHPAVYLLGAAYGGGAINPLIKALVDRSRPVLPDPITTAPGLSFPSGHAMGATVAYGAILLVALSYVGGRGRIAAWLTAITLIGGVGASRLVLGVHYVTDVVAGWAFGIVWLIVSAVLFNVWRQERGARTANAALEGVEPQDAETSDTSSEGHLQR